MKKLIILLVLLSVQNLFSQNEKLSVRFDNTPLQEALLTIESQTNYKFFYIQDWLNDITVSGNFVNEPLAEILQDLLEETLLNYYLLDSSRIILTQNNLIYEDLPEGFFGQPTEEAVVEEDTDTGAPVFNRDVPESESGPLETITIGKETRSGSGKYFTLRGRIINEDTGDPLSYLSVLVRDKNIGAVTDENGYYEIRLPAGSSILETRSLETEDFRKRILIYSDGELNISLRESYEQLGEIYLESNSDKNVKQAITGVEQINVSEIKNIPLVLGERDILKVATTLPGISTAGEGAAGYNVRGGRADQNLILLDDAVIYNPTHFFGIFSALNPFTSGDVNIYKGSIPAEYGGRLSSVFDITTRDANITELAGEASVGPVTSSIALDVPIVKEKAGLLIGGRSTYSGWILRSLNEEALRNSTASFYDVVAKYNHIIGDNSEIEATGYVSRDNFSITSDSVFSYSNSLLSLRYNRTINEKNRGSLILSNSGYRFNIDYESEFSNNFRSTYNINETELKLNLKYLHSGTHQFDYGISSKLYAIRPGELNPLGEESLINPISIPRERGLESAIYISDNYNITDRLLVNAGLRYSFFTALGSGTENIYMEGVPKSEATVIEEVSYGNNEPIKTYGGPEVRLSARYFLLEDLSLKGSYNNTIQYIHTLTNNTTVSPTDMYKLSDLNIEPQRANHFSLGLYKNLNQNMYELSLEGFFKESENMLDFKVGADLFLNESIETEVLQGEGRSYGGEFLLRKTKGRLNGWLGYSYTRSLIKLDGEFPEERVNRGEYFPSNFDKPHDVSLVANYKLTKRFSFSTNFVYQTGRPVTFPIGKYNFNGAEYVFYSDRNQFRIPDYYRLDLSFNVEGNHKTNKIAHSFWNISVYNVLGRNNPYSVFFVTNDGEVRAYQSSIFSIPVPTITYNIKF